MALTIRGQVLTAPYPVRYSEGRRNADGTMETDVTFAIATSLLMANLPTRGVSAHPLWSDFKADLFTWSTPLAGVTLLRVFYVSATAPALTPGSVLPLDVEEEANNIASEQPITTAANFLVAAGGLDPIVPLLTAAGGSTAWPTTGSPAYAVTVDPATGRWPGLAADGSGTPHVAGNQAVFDTFGQNKDPAANDYNPNVGRFLYFAPGSPFVGQESYLLPLGEWSYSYSTPVQPNLSDAGRIRLSPPGLPAPAAPINYLCTAMRYRRSGAVYRVAVNWRRSGPRGWNPRIYPAL
jgi:hypothetical protein